MMLLGITILGLIFRLILSNQSFWLDEAASIMAARVPLSGFFEYIKADFHPPLYYLLLKLWLPMSGNTEWLTRLPGILIGTLTIPAVYFLCKEVFGKKSVIPIISSLLLALNPLHVYYSQELRMYSLSTLLIVISWAALYKRNYLLFSIINLLSFFTFYGVVLVFISHAIFQISRKKDYSFFLISFIPLVICFVFWWPIFNSQLVNGGYLKTMLSGWQELSGTLTIKSLLLIPLKFILGRINLEPQRLYYVAGGVSMALFSIPIFLSIKKSAFGIFSLWLLTPLSLASLISLKTPMLGYWRFIFLIPAFVVLIAGGVLLINKKIIIPVTILVCAFCIVCNLIFWTNPKFQREDWRGLSQSIEDKNALVLMAFPYKFAPLSIYHSNNSFIPALNDQYKIDKFLPQKLANVRQNFSKLYLLDYLADITDPQRQIKQIIVNSGYQEINVYNFNNVGLVYEFESYENSN